MTVGLRVSMPILARGGLIGLLAWLLVASPAPAAAETDYSQRTCTVGATEQILVWLSAVVSAEHKETFLSNVRPLTSGSSGGDCGITSISEYCDLVLVGDGTQSPQAIIGEAAPDGPMPQTRASIDFVVAANVPLRGIVLHHADVIDDKELMTLIEAEIRDIVSSKGLDGSAVPVCQCRPDCGPAAKN